MAVYYAKIKSQKSKSKEDDKIYGFELELADLFSEMEKMKDWEDYLIDGLHLNKRGNRLLFELLKDKF